jgi:hypothetical protein
MMSQEHDWVRDHLSALPRPSLPDDVAQRLDRAIAAEAASAPTDAAAPVPAEQGPTSTGGAATPAVPQQASRRAGTRNRTLLALSGVAAALVLLAVVDPFGGPAGIPEEPVGIAAAPESTADGAAEQADDTAISAEAPRSSGGAEDTELDRISGVMTATETPYSRNELAVQAEQVAAGTATAAPSAAPRWADGVDWPAATLDGVRDCVAALPASAEPVVFVDRAEFEGEPALVVARDAVGGALEVFVQDVTCTADDPAIQYRTTVDP